MIGYIIATILAIILGQIVAHLNKKMPPVVAEEITYKEYYSTLFKDFKFDFKWSIILAFIFNILMYFLGNEYITYSFMFVTSILAVVYSVDYRFQLIPDEAHIGLSLIAILNLIVGYGNLVDSILGALIGGGIFLAISVIALLIYKKEGMGFGDVKLMAALGLLFGVEKILVITLVSFFIGAIIGGSLLIFTKKESNSYIAFGPFIVLGSLIMMIVKPNVIIDIYINICSYISDFITNIIWFFVK